MKLFLMMAAIACSNLFYAQIPSNGLIGRWEFSGNANDLSQSANHGTVTGASLTSDRCGNANSAYSFNGTTDYIIMQTAGPTGANSRSVAFWAKTNYTTTTALFTYGSAGPGKSFQIQYNYGCAGVGLDVNLQQITRGGACINDNNWHHIALVFNNSGNQQMNSTELYVDAQLISSQLSCSSGSGNLVLNTGNQTPIVIGNDSNFPNPIRWFKGSLDDYFLYDRALTQVEINQLFNSCSLPLYGNTDICTGSTNTYSFQAMPGAIYTWNLPAGWSGTSSTNVITATTGSNSVSGSISASILTGCGGNLVVSNKVVSVSHCTSIEPFENESSFSIYPNPAKDIVNITSATESLLEVRICDMTGRLLMTEKFIGEALMDISNLKPGLYFVSVDSKAGRQKTFKLLKD